MKRKPLVNGMLIVLAILLVAGMAYQFTPAISSGGGLFKRQTGTPALKVNGQTITVEDLERLRRGNPILTATDTGVLGDDFKTILVSRAVLNALYTTAAKDVKVSRATVDAEVNKVRESNNLKDNKAWTDALQGAGLTDSSYRQQVRDGLAIQGKTDEIKKTVPAATDAEAHAFYDLNTALYQSEARIIGREIVVTDKAKADELLKQARAGADFAKLASENSIEFKDRGGALGVLENGTPKAVTKVVLPNAVADAAFALTGGGITDVISDGNKFYIIKVEKYLAAAPKTFDEAKSDVMKAVNQQKQDAALEKWADGLRQDAKIEYIDQAWKIEDPTVASIAGKNIPYSEVIAQVIGNQQVAAIFQQMPPEQVANLINTGLKPQIVQQLLAGYAAPSIVEKLKLPLVGARQELMAALNVYGARDVKVTEADIQKDYQDNLKQFETPASATVDEASFKDKNAALAFRSDWSGSGDFVAAASKAGGTVSERGTVAPSTPQAPGTLDSKLEAAIFTGQLRSVGEGSLSEVVPVGARYSVAYIKDLKKAGIQPLSAVHSQVETQLLASKKAEAGAAFLKKEVDALKPTNNLKAVLDAQAKRVAATEKAAEGTGSSAPQAKPTTPSTGGSKTETAPAGSK